MSLDDLRFYASTALGNPLRPHFAHAVELVELAQAELRFARADNARLVAENKKLGESLEAFRAAQARPKWDGKCAVCHSPLTGPVQECQTCERRRRELLEAQVEAHNDQGLKEWVGGS